MLRGMPGGLGQSLHISQAPRQCILRVAKVWWYLYMYTCRYIFSPVFCGFLSTALPWLHPLAAKTSYSLLPQDPRVFTIFPFPRSPGISHFVSPTSSPFVFYVSVAPILIILVYIFIHILNLCTTLSDRIFYYWSFRNFLALPVLYSIWT